ncbi:MAG: GNAT family N-acetyltransferase [Prevotellaceae bacterium]|nr:GNAT family N-acetyltransferase [Prevotellaceae bacterium]
MNIKTKINPPEIIDYKKFICEILEVDKAVYSHELQGQFDAVYARFMFNKEMFILLYDGEKIIGYFAFLPVKEALYNKILTEERLFDNDISLSMFEQYEVGKPCNLYAISVAILPKYQGIGLTKKLTDAFFDFVLEKKRQGIEIKNVLATTVSPAGEKFANKLGFVTVKKHKSGYVVKKMII